MMDSFKSLTVPATLNPLALAATTLKGYALLGIVGVVLVALLTKFLTSDKRRKHLPPGPKGLPLIGSLLEFAESDEVPKKVEEWARKYGDIFHLRLGQTDYIYLNTPAAVKELMDKRSSKYSSRPFLPMAFGVVSAFRRMLFMEYGPEWRSQRKLVHNLLNIRRSISYQPVQDFESKQVIFDMLDNPSGFYDHNRRYSASVIMLVTYGYRVTSWNDPVVQEIYSVLDNFTNISAPGAFLVDSFPSLANWPQWLLGNWRSKGQAMYEHDSKVYLKLWRRLKSEVDAGTAAECFCKDFYLADPSKNGIDELGAAFAAGGLVEAGSETTSTTLNNFILAGLLFPEAIAKGQDELDRVVGSDRLPTWDDEQNLPYIRAMVKEILRWRPVNKFGMNHALSEDDWWNGYFLPKNSVVMLNWWAIHRDPKKWENADQYIPERYLGVNESAADLSTAADPNGRDHWTYGAGRRICPGIHVAERSLYINIVRFVWAFDLHKPVDAATGKEIEPTMSMVRGFLSTPNQFGADIRPRSKRHAEVVRREWSNAQREGLKWSRD
ncbi:cytochrome P450 [Tricharina praecox]|uniref:cytochrome P450 n=1 Tax=Tricharina praecox TaxID=43433 RepID=UPI00221ED83F|nr:cytochrome P450 [Tricharina praecox]KAI5843189.1 cytochrome P450 [Tricharina praecox]